ncbi:helix-turn-helix transcriptional regulator [Microbacterium arborescens]
MALPHRRQQLAKFIPFHDLSQSDVAKALGTDTTRVKNLCRGGAYPSPGDIAVLERLFGLPIEVLFEEDMLTYRDGPWPAPRGGAALKLELARAHESDDTSRAEAGE